MNSFFLPDFTCSVVNVSATLAELLGAPNQNPTLPVLKEELGKGYEKVVFLCFDGMGLHPMERNLKEGDFLFRHVKQRLRSTFPSTTTNATRSLLTNQLPLEHGWFGWSMYFPALHRNVDIFLNRDSLTREPVDCASSPLDETDYYFHRGSGEWSVSTVFPPYIQENHPGQNHVFHTPGGFWSAVEGCCQKPGKQFVYGYFPEPDATMHKQGVTSPQAKEILEQISQELEGLHHAFPDTLFVITADHGQVDVEGYVELYRDQTLLDLLEIYPFLEARAPAFLVKKGRESDFQKYFRQRYGEDFLLYRSQDLLDQRYFGDRGDKAFLLGDFIAVGTYTHKQALLTPKSTRFRGHHTSLTEEMEVPLILLGKE